MIKNATVLEIKKNERSYQLVLDPSSPLGELYDVLHEMKAYVFQRIQEAEKPKESKSE